VTGQEAPNQYCEAIRQSVSYYLGNNSEQAVLSGKISTDKAGMCSSMCQHKNLIDANKPYRSVRGYQYYLTGFAMPPEMPGAKVQLILLDLRHD